MIVILPTISSITLHQVSLSTLVMVQATESAVFPAEEA